MRALLVTAALLASAPSMARESRLPLQSGLQPADEPARWALGFLLGAPFGLSLKRYLGGPNAWDAYIDVLGPGYRFGGDYIWNLGRLERHAKFDLDVYAGVGPFVGVLQGPCGIGYLACGNGAAYVGGRVPVGVELLLKEAPLTFGVEVAPGIAVGSGIWGVLVDFLFAVRILL